MLSFFLSLLLSSVAWTEEVASPTVVAICPCTIYNEDGVAINRDKDLIPTVPVLNPTMFGRVTGEATLKTVAEREHCQVTEEGALTYGCAVAMWYAENRATYQCLMRARELFPGNDIANALSGGFGMIETCHFSLEE